MKTTAISTMSQNTEANNLFPQARKVPCQEDDILVGVNLSTSVYHGSRTDDILVGVNLSTSVYYGTTQTARAGRARQL